MTDSAIPLVILAAGGHASEVRGYLDSAVSPESFEFIGYLDDARKAGEWFRGPVLGAIDDIPRLFPGDGKFAFITAVGSNAVRRAVVDRVRSMAGGRARAISLIERSAWLGSAVRVGDGTCVAPGVVITTRVTVGSHCILNIRSSVSHDCVVGDFVNINPGAVLCGNVQLGDGVYVGAGAVIREKVRIGENTVIGAGAVVLRDLPANVTAVGVPAKILEREGNHR